MRKIDKASFTVKSMVLRVRIDRGNGGPFVTTFELRYLDDFSKVDLRDMQEKSLK